jgi:smad nuclear-interacting protein 1
VLVMDSSRSSRWEKEERRPRRSRSSSYDSGEERRRRRRRKEREMSDREKGREAYEDGGRDRYDDGNRKRRRSRSPATESCRRREDHDVKPRSTRDRSPRRDSKDRNIRSSREGSASQMTRKSKGPLPSQAASFQANKDPSIAVVVAEEAPEKQKPSLAPTGLLAAASNSVAQNDGTSIVLKYHEPAEARKPPAKDEWKLFVFKGADILETIELSKRSCWLVGRELAVVDMAAEHPSISKQHAVIQFRYIEKKNEFGDRTGKVKPYIIDLESANGTLLNKEELPPSRYLELRDKDMIQFGHSTREYVLMLSKG